jgi:hypothetical protein
MTQARGVGEYKQIRNFICSLGMNKMWPLQMTTASRVPSAVDCTPLQKFIPAFYNKLPQLQ